MGRYIIADVDQERQGNRAFWLHFYIKGDGTEWLDAGLPTPHYFGRPDANGGPAEGYYVAWLIDGVIGTDAGQRYLSDLIARLCFALPVRERLMWPPHSRHLQHSGPAYKLRELSAPLPSRPQKRVRLRGTMAKDQTFWDLKLWVEYQIKANGGPGSMVPFQPFLDYAYSAFPEKEKSTIRAKCRAIWEWYEKRDWQFHIMKTGLNEEELYMTRKERAISNARAKAEKTRKKVINAITGLYSNEFRKKSGAWHIGRIVEATGVSRNIVAKYIKEWEREKEEGETAA